MSAMKGGCLCGAIRYRLKSAPKSVILCHCTHCQKVTGSAFSTNALMRDADIVFEGAPLATYEDRGESGNVLKRVFCPRCGSSLGSISDGIPGMFILKVGSLDDHSSLSDMTAQIWSRSQQPWVKFACESPVMEKGFPAR